ncbi:cytidine deaminase-like protein [Pisolithus marmoratus]|nr:cytidine deaminase-like protein [Pisolithus marmoratus]
MDAIDKLGLATAFAKARKSYHEGGLPIGAALVYHSSSLNPHDPVVLGCSHNQRIQKSSPTLHAEIAALEDAGRLKTDVYTKSTMAEIRSPCSPCSMCTGAILLYKIPRVVIGENENFMGWEQLLKEHGVEVKVVDDAECKGTHGTFHQGKARGWQASFLFHKTTLEWNEDIGVL